MKRVVIFSAIFYLFNGAVSANESCSTELAENGTDTKVISFNGNYLGYVSPNPDGSYFIWLVDKGAMNQSVNSFQEAVDLVCNLGEDK